MLVLGEGARVMRIVSHAVIVLATASKTVSKADCRSIPAAPWLLHLLVGIIIIIIMTEPY